MNKVRFWKCEKLHWLKSNSPNVQQRKKIKTYKKEIYFNFIFMYLYIESQTLHLGFHSYIW